MLNPPRIQSSVIVVANFLTESDEILDYLFHSVEVIIVGMRLKNKIEGLNFIIPNKSKESISHASLFGQEAIHHPPPLVGQTDEDGVAVPTVE
jgi:hypothetical protein